MARGWRLKSLSDFGTIKAFGAGVAGRVNGFGVTMAVKILLGLMISALCSYALEKPNIVFILADDQGWGDVGFHDPALYTPNLDRLAGNGLELTQHYVAPQCTPTRVSFLTGRYAQRFGPQAIIAGYNIQAIPYETPTLATLLKKQGYETALVGKWHLGSVPGQHPNRWGFDYSYGYLGGAVGLYDHRYRLNRKEVAHTWHRNGVLIPGSENGAPYEEGRHVTDLLTEDAVRFLKDERTNPFFLYVAMAAVHTPLAEEEKWFDDPEGKIRAISDPSRRLMAASLHHLDYGVGRIIQTLEATGQLENTIVIYSSDNGGVVGGHRGGGYTKPNPALTAGYSSNGELRSGKQHVFEGGIRVPTIVYWPGMLGKGKIETPVHICDWLPTLGKLAGITEMPDLLDGRNIWPQLRGKPYQEERIFYWARGSEIPWERRALRKGDWKMVNEGQGWQLFNLKEDPGEKNDLAETCPERLEMLLSAYETEAKKDEGRWLPSVWIQGPDSFVPGKPIECTLMCSLPMNLKPEHLEIEGADLLGIRKKGKTGKQLAVLLQPTGDRAVSLRVKAAAVRIDGLENQPSHEYVCDGRKMKMSR